MKNIWETIDDELAKGSSGVVFIIPADTDISNFLLDEGFNEYDTDEYYSYDLDITASVDIEARNILFSRE